MYTEQLPDGVTSNTLHLEAQNFNIHYLQAGEKHTSDEVILLVHGWPTSAFLYRHMMLPLAQHHRVIAIDLPGFGYSDKDPSASYSFRYHADIIQGLIESLGIKKVHLVVHDLGGPIGLWWASQNENLISSYVLLDTIIYDDFSWAVKLFVSMTLIPGVKSWFSRPAGLKFAMRLGMTNKHRLEGEVMKGYLDPFTSKPDRQALLRTAHKLHMNGFKDLSKHMEALTKPLCMIYAENDVILPEVGDRFRRLQQHHPDAELHVVPNCGHFLQEDCPEDVLKPMLGFYNSICE